MQKREQKFTTEFIKWAKNKWRYGSCLFEVKSAKPGEPISFSQIADHQIANLQNVKNFVYKISDIGRVQTPTDVVCIMDGNGYLVFNYGSKDFYVFEINEFLRILETYPRKSMHEEDASLMATYSGTLA